MRHISKTLLLALFGLLLGGAACANILLAAQSHTVAPVWLVNALAIALLRQRPQVGLTVPIGVALLAMGAANIVCGATIPTAIGFAAINAFEILAVSLAIRRFDLDLGNPGDLGKFGLIGAASAAASGILAATLLAASSGASFLLTFKTWFLADLLGLIILVPPLTTVSIAELRDLLQPQRFARVAAVLLVTVMVACLAFGQRTYPAMILILPCLILATFTLKFVGAAAANACVVVIAITLTASGYGPIAHLIPEMVLRMMFLQMFLAVNTMVIFPVASVLSHRKRTVERLEASERLHTLLAENTKDMISRIDLAGRRLYVSPASFALLGYTPAEMLGGSPIAAIHPDDRDRVEAACRSLLSGTVDPTCTYRIRHKDGHYIWLEALYRLVRDPLSGEPKEFIASTRDVSRRQAAEQSLLDAAAELLENNRMLLMAEAAAKLGHWRLDMLSGEVSWSDEVYRIHGRGAEFIPQFDTAIDASHPDDVPRVSPVIANAIQTGEPFHFEARIVRPDGALRWISARGQAEVAANGKVTGLFGIFQDISDEIEARSELIDARIAAERALAAKSLFTATMSHEIRTPLSGMLAVVELLRDTATDAEREKYHKSLDTSAQLLSSIVDDVLIFSKLDEGKVDIEAIDFDPRAVVSGVVDAFATEADAKGLTLDCEIAPELPAVVVGDPTRLQRVVTNLVSNAIKFTQTGGIVVSARRGGAVDKWHFAVTDTGIGVGESQRAAIFEPFVQADASITRTYGGTGLGLSICRMLVEAMGGTLEITSSLGAGSTFAFDLMMPAAAGDAGKVHAASIGPLDILIAEDNDTNRFLVSRLVERLGHRVTSVANGEAAVDALRTRVAPFDLVLMDIQMPGLDGMAATRAIREDGGIGAATPIFAFTADASAERRDTILAAGMNGVLVKPLKVAELEAVIRATFATDPPLSSGGTAESPSAAADEPIDGQRIDAFEQALGRNACVTLLTLLIEDSSRSCDRIATLIADRRFEALRLEVHSLRGAAASVGAHALIDVLRVIDEAAREEVADPAMLAMLETAVADVIDAARRAVQTATSGVSPTGSSERSASTA